MESPGLIRTGSYYEAIPINGKPGSGIPVKQTAMGRFYDLLLSPTNILTSAFVWASRKTETAVTISEKGHGIPHSTPDRKQRLRRVPFTFTLFRTIARRMSIHSWIMRVISRANVPSFERTITEMPLYSAFGENLGPQKAIREFLLALQLVNGAKTQQYITAAPRMSGKTIWRCLSRILQERN